MSASDDTRQRLLLAAGRLFAEKGKEAATIREICRAAGANLAAVNYHFRDKEQLYIEAVKSACRQQTDQAPTPEWPPGTPALDKLRDFIRVFVRRLRGGDEVPWHRQLFLRELAQPTAACAAVVRDNIRPEADKLADILGELLPGVPEVKRRLTAFSIVGQCVFYRMATPIIKALVGEDEFRTYDPTLLSDHIIQFTLAALGQGKPIAAGRVTAAKNGRG
jgi:AcrR family transcriptional regulator